MNEVNTIPKHWQVKRLEEVCEEIFAGGDVPADNFSWTPNDACQIPVYSNGEKNKGLYGYTHKAKINFPCVTISARGTIGCTEVRTHPFYPIVRLMVLKPSACLNVSFFKYAIDNCHLQHTGSSVPQLTVPTVKAIRIAFPPLKEQQAIVAVIEELFSILDKGNQHLLTAQSQLKKYRQSLLKAAFEGKLTHQQVEEGKLPRGWVLKKLSETGKWTGGGTPAKSNKDFWANGSIPWITSKDMKTPKIQETKDYITRLALENSSAKRIPNGSILFVVRSGILRRTLPVAMATCDVTVNQDIQAFTPKNLLPEYVYWYTIAKNESIRKKCRKDGTTVESIKLSLLKSFPIPVCPPEEQKTIVDFLEDKFTQCDHLEKTISKSIKQAELLRQSILKKAMEGTIYYFNHDSDQMHINTGQDDAIDTTELLARHHLPFRRRSLIKRRFNCFNKGNDGGKI